MALKDYYGQTCWCVKCKECYLAYYPIFRRVCPAGERFKFMSYYAPGKLAIARYLIDGTLDYHDSVARVAYTCTLCGACEEICQRTGPRFEPRKIIEELRAECFRRGLILEPHKGIINSVKNYHNVWMQPRALRDAWAKDLKIDFSPKRPEVLYYLGCTYAYNPALQSIARKTAELFNRAGVKFTILGNQEVCCGSPLEKIGDRESFGQIARENLEAFNNLKVDRVVTSCAGCYSTFKIDYPNHGRLKFEVLSSVEFLETLFQKGKLKFNRKDLPAQTVTYHDPCHLGRRSAPVKPGLPAGEPSEGIYDPPRNLLARIPGIKLIEMERIREYSWCCGAGGGLKSAFPDVAIWSAGERIAEAKETGAKALVTACPWCEMNLRDAIESQGSALSCHDLVELIHQAI